jgi:hypothetical protein
MNSTAFDLPGNAGRQSHSETVNEGGLGARGTAVSDRPRPHAPPGAHSPPAFALPWGVSEEWTIHL